MTVVLLLPDSPPSPPSLEELMRLPVLRVPVRELAAAYAWNELAGERVFAKRRLVVFGRVNRVRREGVGLLLRLVDPGGGAVRCCLTEEHAEELVELKRGELVTVTGVVAGMEGREVRVMGVGVERWEPPAGSAFAVAARTVA